MRRLMLAVAVVLSLAGCALQRTQVSTAVMPPETGLGDPVNAVQFAAWAFALPSRTRNDPLSAVKAVAALDYAAGYINTSPVFIGLDPLVSQQLLIGRTAMRRTLGIPEDAPSQAVVNAMTQAMLALEAHNQAAVLQALSSPTLFTFGPDRTLALLTNLPYMQLVNIGTINAENAINGSCMSCGGAM